MPASRRFAIAAVAAAMTPANSGRRSGEPRPDLATARINREIAASLVRVLCLVGMIFCVTSPFLAQGMGKFSVQVESNLVVIPVEVWDKRHMQVVPRAELACWAKETMAFNRLKPSEPYLPRDCDRSTLRGLTAKDFRIFEDGVEQKVQSVTSAPSGLLVARDNRGWHIESSSAPRAIWSDRLDAGTDVGVDQLIYRVAYVPQGTGRANCHSIDVKVDRHNAFVEAAREYCDTQSPSDILNGSSFGARLGHDLASKQEGAIALSAQAGSFFAGAGMARADLALEIPADSLTYRFVGTTLDATVGFLGVIRSKSGALIMRLSDFACCDATSGGLARTSAPIPPRGLGPALNHLTEGIMPARYETQVDLHPGVYDLQVVLSDGTKFGRVEMPLTIDPWDGKQLAMSSVMLCKRFCDAHVAEVERKAANFAPQYLPLVSKGIEFTPAGDTRFKKKSKEPLIAYFEVYEPLLVAQPATKVEAHIRILNAKTGQLVKDFPPVDAREYETPGSWKIPIARKIPFEEFPKGAYRLEVQATDSAGRSTPWRSANFTVK